MNFDSPIRFIKDGCFRKGTDGLELLTPESGAIFEFKSERDLTIQTTRFAPIRIVVVVKELVENKDVFYEKLVLLTSKKQIIVASKLNDVFDRNACSETHDWYTTLILVVPSKDSPSILLNTFPFNKPARFYKISYNQETKTFDIPSGLNWVHTN